MTWWVQGTWTKSVAVFMRRYSGADSALPNNSCGEGVAEQLSSDGGSTMIGWQQCNGIGPLQSVLIVQHGGVWPAGHEVSSTQPPQACPTTQPSPCICELVCQRLSRCPCSRVNLANTAAGKPYPHPSISLATLPAPAEDQPQLLPRIPGSLTPITPSCWPHSRQFGF